MAQVTENFRNAQVPHLTLSMDELDGVVSSTDLGSRMGLPASPAIVLGQMSAGNPAVLCIDQLDALSFVSGSNVAGRTLLDELIVQASHYRRLRLLLVCRSFDLDYDPLLLDLVSGESPTARRIDVEQLSLDDVQSALAGAAIKEPSLTESQIELLRTPIHLYLFLSGGPPREGFASRRDLFDSYWEEKRRRVDDLAHVGAFVNAVARLSDLQSTRRMLQNAASCCDGPRGCAGRVGIGGGRDS